MRKKLRKILPDHEAVRGNRWLAPFENTLLHPRLWHLNRHSAAGGVAVGLFCGLIRHMAEFALDGVQHGQQCAGQTGVRVNHGLQAQPVRGGGGVVR